MTELTIDDTGWLQTVEVMQSPNCDARPDNSEIKLIVIHGISLPPAEFGGGYIQQFFCNRLDVGAHEYFSSICELLVSAHCLIERDGKMVQFVSFLDRAWHAGDSNWHGEQGCNDFSVGIELEGTDDLSYTDQQYLALNSLISSLLARYPGIDAESLCGHSDISPGRKTDPGPAFDWQKLSRFLQGID
ncbi:MAG: 1,6-anhydro-N-acetylmuramyl-L-alanine amidase AmpD [Gammaproteobacteria bacterium]|nr:1,6-anhydro-N-acetylmuramyl-L-alanine amidase AmpD [Gammaproteobacteria bacterium]MCZ6577741.1 1,6-anhydro-N-acetylmuramyl-L-alanine amidase AmpD [Gammaproteobacteria bacterium]